MVVFGLGLMYCLKTKHGQAKQTEVNTVTKAVFLTVAETAQKWGVSETAVRNWIEAGLPHQTRKVTGRKKFVVLKKSDITKHAGTPRK